MKPDENSNVTTMYLRTQDNFDKASLFSQYLHSVFTNSHIDLPSDVNNKLFTLRCIESKVLKHFIFMQTLTFPFHAQSTKTPPSY